MLASRCSVAALAAFLLLLTLGDSIIIQDIWLRQKRQGQDFVHPYSEIVSAAVQHCYTELVADANCCLDSRMTSGVTLRRVRRNGTEWRCEDPDCKSAPKGLRGDDTLFVPEEADCSSPRVLYIHGGSWITGSPETNGYAEFAAKIADATGAMVMSLDYPLVSEEQLTKSSGNFDAIMEASLSALRWLADNGPEEGCPANVQAPLFLAGDSSGGGSALSLAVLVGTRPELLPGRRLAGAFFYSPWTNLVCNSPEYYHNAFAKIEERTYNTILARRPSQTLAEDQTDGGLTSKPTAFVGDVIFRTPPSETSWKFEMNAMGYVGDDRSRLMDPVASPYYASVESLRGLPPLYFAVGSSESILADSVVVAQNAAAGGVDVHLDVHAGMWHVFPMYSEGCGGKHPLWNGKRAMDSTALFVRHIAETGRPPYSANLHGPIDSDVGRKEPHTTISYDQAVPNLQETDADMGRHLKAIKLRRKERLQGAAVF